MNNATKEQLLLGVGRRIAYHQKRRKHYKGWAIVFFRSKKYKNNKSYHRLMISLYSRISKGLQDAIHSNDGEKYKKIEQKYRREVEKYNKKTKNRMYKTI